MLQEVNKMLDLGELIKRAVKYLVEGFMVAVAAYAIPKRSLPRRSSSYCLDCCCHFQHSRHLRAKHGGICAHWRRIRYRRQPCRIPSVIVPPLF